MDELLKGLDYINRPLLSLQSHPDFNMDAWHKIMLICNMPTEEILRIDLNRSDNA